MAATLLPKLATSSYGNPKVFLKTLAMLQLSLILIKAILILWNKTLKTRNGQEVKSTLVEYQHIVCQMEDFGFAIAIKTQRFWVGSISHM